MQRSSTFGNAFLAYVLVLILVASIFSVAAGPIFVQPSYASHENISVEITDDVTEKYDPGDSVTIEGTIDDQVDDEKVTIKIQKPSGTTTHTEDNIDPDSGGDFDFVYETPSSADDGVWSVEVEYDNERVYTFFIIDDDSDAIDIELDETSATYEAGSDVEISGQVDQVETGEDVVEITVTDPTNDEIVDSDEAELGDGSLDDEEFEYTVELPNDADHGRYAIEITYGDDQEGSILFEVEDGGGSSGGDPITADTDEDAYEPGQTVEVSGQVEDVQSSTNLEIVVEDPDGNEIESDDDVDVESNGDFSFEFDLDDNADEGEYMVTITYGSDDLDITFDVDEDAGSSGGSSTELTARLSKSSFLAGESMTVTGTVPKIVSDEEVTILVYDKNSVFVGSAAYIEPKSDKSYSATLKLKTDLEAEDDYTVRVNYNGEEEVRIEFSITGQLTGSDAITIKTDKSSYPAGSTVTISGKVATDLLIDGEKMLIQVFNPEDTAYRFDQVDVRSDGSYSYEVVIGGKLGIGGVYEVKATYNGKQSKTTFEIEGGKAMFELKAAGQTYKIQYDITAGSIKSMFINEESKKLVIVLADAIEDGQLTLVLPREVINSAANGTDIPYIVASTDLEAGAGLGVDIDESETTNSARTLVIDFKQGTDLIEISGTSVVPEFGALSAIILAIAIVAIIAVTARFRSGTHSKFGSGFLTR